MHRPIFTVVYWQNGFLNLFESNNYCLLKESSIFNNAYKRSCTIWWIYTQYIKNFIFQEGVHIHLPNIFLKKYPISEATSLKINHALTSALSQPTGKQRNYEKFSSNGVSYWSGRTIYRFTLKWFKLLHCIAKAISKQMNEHRMSTSNSQDTNN